MKTNKTLFFLSLLLGIGVLTSCSEDDDHDHDHEGEEVINEVVLTFTPTGGGTAITATWFDSDGEGSANPDIDAINLAADTEYQLSITMANTLGESIEDVTAEILEEDHEHMIFFAFTTGIFSDPTGDGNVDSRADNVRYNDQDENGQPVGLSTSWTTGSATTTAGTFTVVLKHQPDLKTATSDSNVGGTDIDIDYPININ